MSRIAAELRCLVCQNQTIADSDASLAVDLRREARSLLKQGKSDAEVIDYMTARYGDFVLYRPPLRATTFPPLVRPGADAGGGGTGRARRASACAGAAVGWPPTPSTPTTRRGGRPSGRESSPAHLLGARPAGRS